MAETFLALFAAHLLADFVLQTSWIVQRKKRLEILLLHAAIVGLVTTVAIGGTGRDAMIAIGAITLTHLAMDGLKAHKLPDQLWAFVLDQAVHILVVLGVSAWVPELAAQGWWSQMPGDGQALYYAGLVVLSGLIAAVPLGGILIGQIVRSLSQTQNLTTPIGGMANAGRYIGWLERTLTLLLVLISQPEGIGFLLAAKSILRFGDIKTDTDRSQAEYVIIGTFLSFGWGLLAALLTQAALRYYWHQG
jgi:hypothetical protein